MTLDRSPGGGPVPSPTGVGRGPGVALAAAGLAAIVAFGLLGRLIPGGGTSPPVSSASSPGVPTPAPVGLPGFRLVSPTPGTVWFRTTEIEVRGVAPPNIRTIDAVIRIAGSAPSRSSIQVEPGGQFGEAIPFVPPGVRAPATLELREAGGQRRPLAEVLFSVEAGALLLIREGDLQGRAGAVLVTDVLVYGDLREVRGLLTSRGGDLFAMATRPLPRAGADAGRPPRTTALELLLPADAPSGRTRLHVLGIGHDGTEVEHVDANVRVTVGG